MPPARLGVKTCFPSENAMTQKKPERFLRQESDSVQTCLGATAKIKQSIADSGLHSEKRIMVELAIIGLLVGAGMAPRFTVFALVPAIIFMLAVIAMAGVAGGETVWWIVGVVAAVSISIQFGYLGGAILQAIRRGLFHREIRKPAAAPGIYFGEH
jgi:hypothetical protein